MGLITVPLTPELIRGLREMADVLESSEAFRAVVDDCGWGAEQTDYGLRFSPEETPHLDAMHYASEDSDRWCLQGYFCAYVSPDEDQSELSEPAENAPALWRYLPDADRPAFDGVWESAVTAVADIVGAPETRWVDPNEEYAWQVACWRLPKALLVIGQAEDFDSFVYTGVGVLWLVPYPQERPVPTDFEDWTVGVEPHKLLDSTKCG